MIKTDEFRKRIEKGTKILQFYKSLDLLPDEGGQKVELIKKDNTTLKAYTCEISQGNDWFIGFYRLDSRNKELIDINEIKGWRILY